MYLQYLESPNLDEILIVDKFPLAKYAAQNWVIHAREAEGSTEICKMALRFLHRDELCYKRSFLFHDIDRPWRTIGTRYNPLVPTRRARRCVPTTTVSPLYYASFVGLVDIVRSLLERGEEINEGCGFFGNALSAAASQVCSV